MDVSHAVAGGSAAAGPANATSAQKTRTAAERRSETFRINSPTIRLAACRWKLYGHQLEAQCQSDAVAFLTHVGTVGCFLLDDRVLTPARAGPTAVEPT